jgi:hypothetical protein
MASCTSKNGLSTVEGRTVMVDMVAQAEAAVVVEMAVVVEEA